MSVHIREPEILKFSELSHSDKKEYYKTYIQCHVDIKQMNLEFCNLYVLRQILKNKTFILALMWVRSADNCDYIDYIDTCIPGYNFAAQLIQAYQDKYNKSVYPITIGITSLNYWACSLEIYKNLKCLDSEDQKLTLDEQKLESDDNRLYINKIHEVHKNAVNEYIKHHNINVDKSWQCLSDMAFWNSKYLFLVIKALYTEDVAEQVYINYLTKVGVDHDLVWRNPRNDHGTNLALYKIYLNNC